MINALKNQEQKKAELHAESTALFAGAKATMRALTAEERQRDDEIEIALIQVNDDIKRVNRQIAREREIIREAQAGEDHEEDQVASVTGQKHFYTRLGEFCQAIIHLSTPGGNA